MVDISELVERLTHDWGVSEVEDWEAKDEAADVLEKQAAEIERLRGYMARVAAASEYYGKDDTSCSAQTLAIAHHSTYILARVALNEKQKT